MRKQIAIVVLFMLLFAGVGSSALVSRSLAGAKPLTVVQREHRLGPKPVPHWYWRWLRWRLNAQVSLSEPARPKLVPRRIPRWAWRRLHYFLLARTHVAGRGGSGRTNPPSGGPNAQSYEQATSYTRTRPSFTPTRTVEVSNASQLRSAISGLQAGDLIKATAAFTVQGETVIKNRLSAPAELDLSGVRFVYGGGNNLPAVWVDNAQNLYIYGGDLSTADTGGTCLLDYASQHVLWWGFTAHDCGGGGVGIMAVKGPVSNDDFQGTIWKVGQNRNWDPHTEKGSGLHAALLDDSGSSYAFVQNRFAFYAHDIPTGACVEAGNSVKPSAANGNVLYLKCVNETYVSTIQTGGNGLQLWGDLSNLGLDVKYLEVENAQGRALDTNGMYAGTGLGRVTVEYGRASNTNRNARLNEPKRRLPWDWRGGVVYKAVRPAR